jgi:hypothetical protein
MPYGVRGVEFFSGDEPRRGKRRYLDAQPEKRVAMLGKIVRI